jgi:hypothetical protein
MVAVVLEVEASRAAEATDKVFTQSGIPKAPHGFLAEFFLVLPELYPAI